MILDIFASIALAIGAVKDSIGNSITNDKLEDAAKNNNSPVYYDIKGRSFDINTREEVLVKRQYNHTVITNLNGKAVRDLTQEKYEERQRRAKEEAIANGKRFFRCYAVVNKGDYYQEISTGKIYKKVLADYGDRFHKPNEYYVEVVIRDGKEDYTAKKEFRKVYEFGEGPTDQEGNERERLFQEYSKAEKEYRKFGRTHDLSVVENHEKSMRLFMKYSESEKALTEYDRFINQKYFVKEED